MNIIFLLSGFFSSLLSLLILELEGFDWIGPGFVFSLVLLLLLRKRIVTKPEKVRFVIFATLAYTVAYAVTFALSPILDVRGLSYKARDILACAPFIIGGIIGGWLLFLVLNKYIFKASDKIKPIIFGLLGGLFSSSILLGEISKIKSMLNTHAIGEYLLLNQNNGEIFGQMYPEGTGLMFLVWQMGMAFLIARSLKKLNV